MINGFGLTKADACRQLDMSREEVDRLIKRGELCMMQFGRYRRIPMYMIRDYCSRQFALTLVYHCVRNNTSLERLHAGSFPKSDTDDLSDIKVVGPHGEVPWNQVSRISDAEIKILMKEIVNNMFTVLASRAEELMPLRIPQKWDRPEWVPRLTKQKLGQTGIPNG